MSQVTVPKDVTESAVNQMLTTIAAQYAQYEVQQVANAHADDAACNAQGETYADKYAELAAAEARVREKYAELLG